MTQRQRVRSDEQVVGADGRAEPLEAIPQIAVNDVAGSSSARASMAPNTASSWRASCAEFRFVMSARRKLTVEDSADPNNTVET
jgi:hypothetical protein